MMANKLHVAQNYESPPVAVQTSMKDRIFLHSHPRLQSPKLTWQTDKSNCLILPRAEPTHLHNPKNTPTLGHCMPNRCLNSAFPTPPGRE